jgi:hypothetical protein
MGVEALASTLERLADSDTAAMEAGDAAAVLLTPLLPWTAARCMWTRTYAAEQVS